MSTHQIIDGYGQRFEVLCGKTDWQTAHQDIRKAPNPCPDCLALVELAGSLNQPSGGRA